MRKIILFLALLMVSSAFADEKPGRFFKDQPDVTNDPQVHFIYLLNKDSKDREWDINGKMESELMEVNEKFFEMTKGKQKFRYDMRKDGKLDISFVRFDKKYKGNYGMNYPDAFLTKNGFNDPNKLYFSWVDVGHRDGGQGSVHHGYIFLKSKYIGVKAKRSIMTLHELAHVAGLPGRVTKEIMEAVILEIQSLEDPRVVINTD